jgi:hypothetical protein
MDDDIAQPKAMGLPPPQFLEKKVSSGRASYCDEAYNVTTYGLPYFIWFNVLVAFSSTRSKLSLE